MTAADTSPASHSEGFLQAASEARKASRAYWIPGGKADKRNPVLPITAPWPWGEDIPPLCWPCILDRLPLRENRRIVLAALCLDLLAVPSFDVTLAAILVHAANETFCDPPLEPFDLGRLIGAAASFQREKERRA